MPNLWLNRARVEQMEVWNYSFNQGQIRRNIPGIPGWQSTGHLLWAACCQERVHTQSGREQGPGLDAETLPRCQWGAAAGTQKLFPDPPVSASLWTHTRKSQETWGRRTHGPRFTPTIGLFDFIQWFWEDLWHVAASCYNNHRLALEKKNKKITFLWIMLPTAFWWTWVFDWRQTWRAWIDSLTFDKSRFYRVTWEMFTFPCSIRSGLCPD